MVGKDHFIFLCWFIYLLSKYSRSKYYLPHPMPMHCAGDTMGFLGGTVVKNMPANARDSGNAGSIPGLERSPEGGNGNPLQHSCLENSRTEKPDKLQSMGSQRVGHDLAHTHT